MSFLKTKVFKLVKVKNLTKRIITGIILGLIIILSIISGPYSFILLISVINLLGLFEFYKLFQAVSIKPLTFFGLFQSTLLLLSVSLIIIYDFNWKILLINVPITFVIYLTELYSRKKNPFQNLAFTFFGMLYISIPSAFLLAIAFSAPKPEIYNSNFMTGCFLLVWASDIGAYFTGKQFGKHKLFKRISPNKTWEGSFGGVCSALLIAIAVSKYSGVLNINHWLAIALIIIVTGSYGDLIKSLMKRSLFIKDSGTILPGHGGILDRFDSLLSSAPFIFLHLTTMVKLV